MSEENQYSRVSLVERLERSSVYDVLVIGGGATGLGVALDAASRGFSTVLLEQYDFAKGTSSRSTKLIHGGVRYLAQGDLKLVYSALHERDILFRNAAHVVRPQSFIIPCYDLWSIAKYGAGLKLYDLLAGKFNLKRSRFLRPKTVLRRMKNLMTAHLKGGIEYYDGRFDDARLAINIAQTAIEKNAIVLNYFSVSGIHKTRDHISGVQATDIETGKEYSLEAKCVINATGVFVDDILEMDEPNSRKMVRPSQGVHVVIDQKFLDSDSALMIPKTSDGRVLFAVPWQGHLLVGTTDTPLTTNSIEPTPMDSEISFILDNVRNYLVNPPSKHDVKTTFAGLRPLAALHGENSLATKELSRDHKLVVAASGLITITGGKWTTYRKMAEETIDLAIRQSNLPKISSNTADIPIHGCSLKEPSAEQLSSGDLSIYGTDRENILNLIQEEPSLARVLVSGYPYTHAEVVWAIRSEMARTVEDVLARRLRLLFIDAAAAIAAAPVVAEYISRELQANEKIIQRQLTDFYQIAQQYTLPVK